MRVGRRTFGLGALGWVACRPRASATVPLWLGGDLHFGSDPGPVVIGLDEMLRGAVGMANLEGPVGEPPPCPDAAICLTNEVEGLAWAERAGIAMLSIANNHARDRGAEAPGRTARALRQRGFAAVGGPAGPAFVVRAGRGVAVTAHDLTAGVPSGLAEELRVARRRADDLVATFHVTGPPSYLPRPVLRDAVEIALQAGARVVAAHGTHALAPIERRGEAVIAWGLGNLRFSCDCTAERDALILRIELGEGPVVAQVIPIDAGLRGEPARPASDPGLTLDVLEAIGSSPLRRDEARAWLS